MFHFKHMLCAFCKFYYTCSFSDEESRMSILAVWFWHNVSTSWFWAGQVSLLLLPWWRGQMFRAQKSGIPALLLLGWRGIINDRHGVVLTFSPSAQILEFKGSRFSTEIMHSTGGPKKKDKISWLHRCK